MDEDVIVTFLTRLSQDKQLWQEVLIQSKEKGFNSADSHSDYQRVSQHLRLLNNAIQRINDGTFGQCRDCQQTISYSRLSRRPFAQRCIHCQHKHEQTCSVC